MRQHSSSNGNNYAWHCNNLKVNFLPLLGREHVDAENSKLNDNNVNVAAEPLSDYNVEYSPEDIVCDDTTIN